MRVLMIHNYYQQRGGEDESTEQEVRLLEKYGHDVQLYSRNNSEIDDYSLLRKGLLFFEPTWSQKSYQQIRSLLKEFSPEIVHVQNFFTLVSPSVFYACSEQDIPVVFTLRDYRLLCPLGWFFREGQICEDCMKKTLWSSVKYGCYHKSSLQTGSIALMLGAHRLFQTWQNKVSAYITLTEFSRHKFVEGGLPESKIYVRPNFLENDPGTGSPIRKGVVFIGRLSTEKGLDVLLEAWRQLPDIPLQIIGDGPMRSYVQSQLEQNELHHVELVGFLPMQRVIEAIKSASLLVMPSKWYETFGRTIIEAYATGTPVIASNLGAMADLVREKETGLLFHPGDARDLVIKVRAALQDEERRAEWGRKARSDFEQKYSADSAHRSIIQIYKKALDEA
jgi:glycosyltransferase involved in cell wall biosynthesis